MLLDAGLRPLFSFLLIFEPFLLPSGGLELVALDVPFLEPIPELMVGGALLAIELVPFLLATLLCLLLPPFALFFDFFALV